MSNISSPKSCVLFKPGHHPHWIQISRASNDGDNAPQPGRAIEFRNDGFFIEVQEKALRLWNHDLGRLAEAVTASKGALFYQSHWGLLWVPNEDGRYAFCVTKNEEHAECSNEMFTGSPVERLQRAGGFTVAVEDVKSWIVERGRTDRVPRKGLMTSVSTS
jgi:hypothetical protein